MTQQRKMCPICQEQPVGDDFWSNEAYVGDTRTCGDCADIAQIHNLDADGVVEYLAEQAQASA